MAHEHEQLWADARETAQAKAVQIMMEDLRARKDRFEARERDARQIRRGFHDKMFTRKKRRDFLERGGVP